jgi:DNA (cytosine-5)-methyltransferase 1
MKNEDIRLIVIDSFCGAGGVTEGFHRAEISGSKVAKVIIGINHDAKAIESHAANHPETIHFIEDFTTLDANKLLPIVQNAKEKYPNAKVLFWASAECTHHSKAKGGGPRNADSRSLPEHIQRYDAVLPIDIIYVENVVEFIDWGPLDEYGKPVKRHKGEYYNKWRDELISMGYSYKYSVLNAADFGAYTSRVRYFGIFSRDEELIQFPQPTHHKKSAFGLEKWKAVRDVLDLEVVGESIFTREKPLCDATLKRIIAGIEKFVIGEKYDMFIQRYNSGNPNHRLVSVMSPCGTVTTKNRFGLVNIKFLSKAYSGSPESKNIAIDNPAGTVTTVDHHQLVTAYYGNGYNTSVEEPVGTVTTKDRFALVTSEFITNYYSGGGQLTGMDEPNPTIMTVPKQRIVSCQFMDQQFGQSKPSTIDKPSGCLTTNPKYNLVSAQLMMDTQFKNNGKSLNNPAPVITADRHHFYLMSHQFNNTGMPIDKPCCTIIARQDKKPLYLMALNMGRNRIQQKDTDTYTMDRLKQLCNMIGIVDIYMRMLLIEELLRIQGFGVNYKLKGTKAEMKKFIGNAVECTQAQRNCEAIAQAIDAVQLKQAI